MSAVKEDESTRGKPVSSPGRDAASGRDEDEIDLGAYIAVVLERKWLILGIFLVAVVLAVAISLVQPKVYEASSSIMLMPATVRVAVSPLRDFLDTQATKMGGYVEPQLTIPVPTHEALVKSNSVLGKVLERLKTEGLADDELSVEQLQSCLKVEAAEETNVLELTARNRDPSLARDIANFWAEEYEKYSVEIIKGEMEGAGDFIVRQFELAKDNLTKAEQAVKNFDVTERLALLEIELEQTQSQLKQNYSQTFELTFEIDEKKSRLAQVDADIAAMTRDGIWLGSFDTSRMNRASFMDENLDANQKLLREKVLDAKTAYDRAVEKRDSFTNDTKINLLRDQVKSLRREVLEGKSMLAKIEQLSESTAANLNSDVNLQSWTRSDVPLSETLTDLTVWEILSLAEGYNFFETRAESLASWIKQQEADLAAMEKVLLKHETELKVLDEGVERALVNYNFYHDLLKKRQSKSNSLKAEVTALMSRLSYSKALADELEAKVNTLQVTINEKKMRLAELTRQLDICRRAYDNLSSKIEEARIAKAMELGEVKVVSTALEPRHPVAPNMRRNAAVAGIGGLMSGVFLAFCLELRQKSREAGKSRDQAS